MHKPRSTRGVRLGVAAVVVVSLLCVHPADAFQSQRQRSSPVEHTSCTSSAYHESFQTNFLGLSSRHTASGATAVQRPRRLNWQSVRLAMTDDDFSKDNFYNDEDDDPRDQRSPSVSSYLATCIPGLAGVLADELTALDCQEVTPTGNSAVQFVADLSTVLSVLLWTRTPHKLLELLCTTTTRGHGIRTREDLANFVQDSTNVQDLLGNGQGGLLTLSVQVIHNNPRYVPSDINHSHYSALCIKNALCDKVRDMRGDRPTVDIDQPQVPLVAVMVGQQADRQYKERRFNPKAPTNANNKDDTKDCYAHVSLYRQLHVGSLHKRGYRGPDMAIHKAAMKESLAAGLLLKADWHRHCREALQQGQQQAENSIPLVLLDPMAGSGTLVVEAALIAANIAPGLMRIRCNSEGTHLHRMPPVLAWKHDEDALEIWKALLLDATQQAKDGIRQLQRRDIQESDDTTPEPPIRFMANEKHDGALDLLEDSVRMAGLDSIVQVFAGDCQDWEPFPDRSEDDHPADDDCDEDKITESDNPSAQCFVVSNPPWGERLSDSLDDPMDVQSDLEESWEALRFFLRETCPPSTEAWILSGNAACTKHLGLRRSQSVPIQTGRHKLRWLQYYIRGPGRNDVSNETKREEPSTSSPPDPVRRFRSLHRDNDRTEPRKPMQDKRIKVRGQERKRKPSPPSKPVENEWLL